MAHLVIIQLMATIARVFFHIPVLAAQIEVTACINHVKTELLVYKKHMATRVHV